MGGAHALYLPHTGWRNATHLRFTSQEFGAGRATNNATDAYIEGGNATSADPSGRGAVLPPRVTSWP